MNDRRDGHLMGQGVCRAGQKTTPARVRAHTAVVVFGARTRVGGGDGMSEKGVLAGRDLVRRGPLGMLDMNDVAVLEAGDVMVGQKVAERQELDNQKNLADQLQNSRSGACDSAGRHRRCLRRPGRSCQGIDQTDHNRTKLGTTDVDTTNPMTSKVLPAGVSVVVRDAGITLLLCAAVGSVVNLARPRGIPFVQKTEYQILVPCPEGSGEAPAIAADAPELREARTLRVDARSPADHAAWHPAGTFNLPFDYLAPAPPAEVKKIASSGAARVVVFGDGNDPDSGEQLARELAGAGIRNIFFVAGGAPALQKASTGRGTP